MKEHPIIFSKPMVRAILKGKKTQTRRIVKPQPERWVTQAGFSWITPKGEISFRGDTANGPAEYSIPLKYQKGDRLWVRETFWIEDCFDDEGKKDLRVEYRADLTDYEEAEDGVWKPSIYMPRWASRINLEIVSVRIERIQDISDDDVIAEGPIGVPRSVNFQELIPELQMTYMEIARDFFIKLWDQLNDKRGFGWKENPWVWVIEFKRV